MARQASQHTDAELADRLIACGELMSTRLFTELLHQRGVKAQWQDARQLLRTDSRFGKATVDLAATRALCQQALGPLLGDSLVITQGFIGADGDGRTTTLGRGGSDYSAALWPRHWTQAASRSGPTCPASTPRIPAWLPAPAPSPKSASWRRRRWPPSAPRCCTRPPCNRAAPGHPGVRGLRQATAGGTWIRAVALRRQQVLVTLHSLNMFHAYGFLAEVFGILARHRISVDLITTSEVSVSLTLDHTGSQSNGEPILNDKVLAELGQLCKVEVETGFALVALIGNRMSEAAGVGSQVFDAIREHNIRMICYGASAHNLCFLVKEDEAGHIVNCLHRELLD
jgi:aspartate kinase